MANPKHLALLKRGVKGWNQWRKQNRQIVPDLTSVNLYGANLNNVDLSNADLSRSYLFHTSLHRADLHGASMVGNNLSGAFLMEANLSNAELYGADLRLAGLYGANLQRAIVGETIFAHIDLSRVKGLAELQHTGPSPVALYSVQLPPDGSALHFLRGCGVPDEWIDFYRATMMHPIQYHSCFISYSSQDDTLARRLHADLQDRGVRCWFAPEDLKIGDKIRSRIDEAIHLQDKLLLILSEHSLASSWVEVEVEAALEKEQRHDREVLFPVRIDESVMQTNQAWAKQLRRSRYIGDFTNWTNPQAYQQAFDRLLRDLKFQE